MARPGFGLAPQRFRGKGSRGSANVSYRADLFLACRHTKTAWIKAWAELSNLLLQRQGHDNVRFRATASPMFAPRLALVSAHIIPPPTGNFPSVRTNRRDGGHRRCYPPGSPGTSICRAIDL